MTYHLASLRLRSIGERSARFTDLTLDFTAPGGPALLSNTPADSIVWLRNGGGKSSLLSLFYALLLPHANDFMGRAVKRSLTDYVDSGDTAHTIAVWHPADQGTLLGDPEKVLVTGAIYEWQELRRPAEPERDRDRLNTAYYAFFAVPGVIDAATLPLTGDDGMPLRRSAVTGRLRDISAEHLTAMDLSLPRNQREWSEQLQARGIDPELFRRQKEMNHVEGGVEDLFRFASAREFIDFLLDLTVSPEEATPVADRLARIADTLASRPAKTRERDFCREAAITIERIGTAYASLDDAAAALATAKNDASDLAREFSGSLAVARASGDQLQEQRDVIEQALQEATRRRSEALDLEHLYRLRGAELRIEAAQSVHVDARQTAASSSAGLAAWILTGRLAEQGHLDAALARVREEASVERAETAPLRAARDVYAAVLADRLAALAQQTDAEAEAARAQAVDEHRAADDRHAAAEQARGEVAQAAGDLATAKSHLGDLDNQLAAAAASGLLPSADAKPEYELQVRQEVRNEYERELGDVRERREARPERRASLSQQLQRLSTERTIADSERGRTAKDLAELQQRADRIAAQPRIRDLTEATGSAPVDVWAEAPILIRRLIDEVQRADEELIRLQATRLDEERSLDAQARTGLLPTSLDAARVLTALGEHDIPAEAGWSHLRSAWPAARLSAALAGPEPADPQLARLGCGVVVPQERIADATRVLTALGTVTTSLVELYGAAEAAAVLARPAGETVAPAWSGLHQGLVDPGVADIAAQAIRSRLAAEDTTREEVRLRRDADRGLVDALDSLLRDCPDGRIGSLERQLGEYDAALEQLDLSVAQARADLAELDAADGVDSARERVLLDEIAHVGEILIQLRALAARADEAPRWRELLTGASRRQLTAQRDAERHAQLEKDARAAAMQADHRVSLLEAGGADHRSEAARIDYLEPREAAAGTADQDPAVPLDTLRQLFVDADRAYQQRVSESVLAERERGLAQQLSAIAADLSRAPAEVQTMARALLATPGGQSKESRALAVVQAQAEKSAADTAVGTAQAEIAAAQHELAGLESRRSRPARALPEQPGGRLVATAEEASEQAQQQQHEAERAQQAQREAQQQIDTVAVQAERLTARIQAFDYLREGLPEPEDPLAGDPFEGDEAEARKARRVVMDALSAATDRTRDVEIAFSAAVSAARSVAGRYSSVQTPARERVAADGPEVLGATAAPLAQALILRADMIDGELKEIAADQEIVTTSLAHLVSDTLDTLRKAERYSRLPATLGPWAGKQMLRIAFDGPASESDLHAHIDQVIEQSIAEGVKPGGLPLLKEAVHAAAGPRGFRVKVLKPAQDVATTSEDITRLGKWSGGEKLTVCVAIYCTLAALRARNTGRGSASGGVLMLDNPIGRASHGSLVTMQRDVAAAHGVQLIYTTGVKDPDAISRFPNVVRLDNRPGRTRNRRFIVASGPDVASPPGAPAAGSGGAQAGSVRTVTGTRVAHVDSIPDDDAADPVDLAAEE